MSEPNVETSVAGFVRPNILLSAINENGVTTLTVREGAVMTMPSRCTIEEADEEPKDEAFIIRSLNRINFAGKPIDVINDECTYGDIHLVATSPTASEYMALAGKEVVSNIHVRPDDTRAIKKKEKGYIVGRTRIILP